MGAVRTNNKALAQSELAALKKRYDTLSAQKDDYKATQVAIQIKASEAWMALQEGKHDAALAMMRQAAEMENKTEKNPVTPGEVIPAMELLGDMLVHVKKWDEALVAYEADLKTHANRFNGLYGAAMTAERLGDGKKAAMYYRKILDIHRPGSQRPEVAVAMQFLQKYKAS
jgi:tetratricopeptide (TPR) repeat protein